MNLIYKSTFITLIIISICSVSFGQNKIYVGTDYFLSKNYSNDWGLLVGYGIPHVERELILEAEYRTINWGNVISGMVGYSIPVHSTSSWSVSFTPRGNIGWSLFQSKPLLTYGGSVIASFRWQSSKSFGAEAGIGYSYLICPKYNVHFQNNQTDFPIRLGFSWKLD